MYIFEFGKDDLIIMGDIVVFKLFVKSCLPDCYCILLKQSLFEVWNINM